MSVAFFQRQQDSFPQYRKGALFACVWAEILRDSQAASRTDAGQGSILDWMNDLAPASTVAAQRVVAASASAGETPPKPQVFERNLRFMVSRIDFHRADETVQMLLGVFPGLRNFEQLRSYARLFVANEYRPLRLVPAPSDLDSEKIPRELMSRFYEGRFVLTEDEELVYHHGTVHGPFDREKAKALARRLSAASPTNDAQGHILDPETSECSPAMVVSPCLD